MILAYSRDPANRPYLKRTDEELSDGIEGFKNNWGYHPAYMPNIIYYGNLAEYQELYKQGDLYADLLLRQLYDNPYSFAYRATLTIYLLDDAIDNIKNFDYPYIGEIKIVTYGGEIKALALCGPIETETSVGDNNPGGRSSLGNCYDLQLSFKNGDSVKYHYVLNSPYFIPSIVPSADSSYEAYPFILWNLNRHTYKNTTLWEFNLGAFGREEPKTSFLFNGDGDYLFPRIFKFSAQYMIESYPAIDSVSVKVYNNRVYTAREQAKRYDYSNYMLQIIPCWEDLQLLNK